MAMGLRPGSTCWQTAGASVAFTSFGTRHGPLLVHRFAAGRHLAPEKKSLRACCFCKAALWPVVQLVTEPHASQQSHWHQESCQQFSTGRARKVPVDVRHAAAGLGLGFSPILVRKGGRAVFGGLALTRPLTRSTLRGHAIRRMASSSSANALASTNQGDDQPSHGGDWTHLLDKETVRLHQRYRDQTLQYIEDHMEWVQNKGYVTDAGLSVQEQLKIRRAARARFWRWPSLDPHDMHKVDFFGDAFEQQFCSSTPSQRSSDLAGAGDPGEHIFVISLPRRPSKLKNALAQLYDSHISATVVDAVDGDAILCQEDLHFHGVKALDGYAGHSNHNIHLTTGEVGCFMSHFSVWTHMIEHSIPYALILEDDFDFQDNFAVRLGNCLEEIANTREDWNLLYIGRSPMEPDIRVVSPHAVEPGYTLWTVGYIIRLDGARALVESNSQQCFVPLDEFFSIAMGRCNTSYNQFALEWSHVIPRIFRPLALVPPLVMPCVDSMFFSDTAMMRPLTRYVKDLPDSISEEEEIRALGEVGSMLKETEL